MRRSECGDAGQKKIIQDEENQSSCDCDCECKLQADIKQLFDHWDYQSEEVDEVSLSTGASTGIVEKSETLAFHEPNVNPTVDKTSGRPNIVALVDGANDFSLGKFLARPTLISSATWTQATALGTNLIDIQPFYAFFNNTRIKKKIDNYAYMRGKLHVKIIVNSTPFNYGYARAIYNPCEGFSWNPAVGAPAEAKQLIYSQYPHVEILPHNSQGGEMILPQFLHTNWYDLASASFLQNSGTLRVHTFTPLRSANGQAAFSASIQVYAWITDVELLGATVALAVQSDEYADGGPISKPASAVAAISGMLAAAPVIGPFARATSMVAGTVASVARMFGYSNPPVIENMTPVQQSNLPQLASANVSVVMDKLTLDPKSELTYDTQYLDDHKLDYTQIENFVKHESLLINFGWDEASNVVDNQLFSARVQPSLYLPIDYAGLTPGMYSINGTPMSHIAQLFQYWRGDIKFRFKFVVSKFHKGRFRITFDPRGDITTEPDSANVTMTRIVDVGEEDDVTITIPYSQRTAWLRTRRYEDVDADQGNFKAGTGALAPDLNYDNGLISLRVQTLLSAPVSTAAWNLLVFVSAGDNFEFAVPTAKAPSDTATPLSLLPFQSAEYDEDKAMTSTTTVNDFKVNNHSDHVYVTNHGEVFKSLKSLCSRSIISKNYALPNTDPGQLAHIRVLHPRLPSPQGYNSFYDGVQTVKGLVVTGATKGYDMSTSIHPITWVNVCFKAYRGSFHHRWNIETKGFQAVDKLYVTRHPFTRGAADTLGRVVSITPTAGTSQAIQNYFLNITSCDNGIGGAAHTAQRNNNSLNLVYPDYNRYNFRFYVPNTIAGGVSTDDSSIDTYSLNLITKPNDSTAQTSSQVTLTQYISGGVDYKPIYFLAVPTVYYSPTAPALT